MNTCKRCGGCCILGPCKFGSEHPEYGHCIHLYFKDGIAHCPFVDNNEERVIKHLSVGKGCGLQEIEGAWDYIQERVKVFKEEGLISIK